MRILDDGTITPHHPNCFGCGPDNPYGLKMAFRRVDREVHATFAIDARHEGAPGFAQGGVVSAAIDDAMGAVLVLLKRPAVTASLTVDFRAPVLLGRELAMRAWCDEVDGRKLHMRGEVREGDVVVADARALFLVVELSHFLQSGQAPPGEWSGPDGSA
jgi:acyl-coenzyme A thioesterase PaaI-like protein